MAAGNGGLMVRHDFLCLPMFGGHQQRNCLVLVYMLSVGIFNCLLNPFLLPITVYGSPHLHSSVVWVS